MAHGGAAVGRHNGKTMFVPLGVPGETVRVEIVEGRARYAMARLLEVLAPSPDRVAPPCPHYGACGGCDWQHIAYPTQVRFKEQIVRDALRRIGRLEAPVLPGIGAEHPWGYRNHVRFVPDQEGRLGFQRRQSHSVVPIQQCAILHPLLQDVLGQIDLDFEGLAALSLRCGANTGERMIVLETLADEAPAVEIDLPVSCVLALADGRAAVLAGAPVLHERVAGRMYRISAQSFFQVSTEGAERLVDLVGRYLQVSGSEALLDAYCGVGLFALSQGGNVSRALGIEEAEASIADATANASGVPNVEFVHSQVESLMAGSTRYDAVVLDPPRTGASPRALHALVSRQPSRIVYVSCDPATLARDCAALTAMGYRLVQVQPVDMFPQTHHIECVALLRRQV